MHQVQITLQTVESDSFGNIFIVQTPYDEVRKRLKYMQDHNIQVTNEAKVLEYLEGAN